MRAPARIRTCRAPKAEMAMARVSAAAPREPAGLNHIRGDMLRLRDLRKGERMEVKDIRENVQSRHDEQSQQNSSGDVFLRVHNLGAQISQFVESVIGPHGRNESS